MNATQVRNAQLQNTMALAQMFGRPLNSSLYVPRETSRLAAPAASFQATAADVDQDGDEDKYAIRYMGLTTAAGKSLAAGATDDIEVEPTKWVQILEFLFLPQHTEDILLLNFVVGQDPQLPWKNGVMPLGLWATEKDNLLDVAWAGPGTSFTLTVKNVGSVTKVVYGGARVRTIVG